MTFECPICYQNRRAKMVLDCDHMLCKECWKKWSKREQFFCEHMLPVCPTCRHPHGLQHRQQQVDWRILVVLLLFYIWYSSKVPESFASTHTTPA